ncbi:MAG: TAT-variant-translocated molybdopterin oxidoreductase [Bacteroidales bacterium]|nr:TAT-variant-translocated molybdopterin oxidoreductase [Bacteroidales bacterium]
MNKYWKSIEELNGSKSGAHNVPEIPLESSTPMDILADEHNHKSSSRRDFLKWCGISFVSATVLSACENPVKKAIPYLNQPEELIPGKAIWYASTYQLGNEYCPVLVKNRDGRPIKIEGNTRSSISQGGTTARVQASILSLYDNGARYHHPIKNSKPVSWEEADADITRQLRAFSREGKRMALVCPTLISPSTRRLLQDFASGYPGMEIIFWDAVSCSAIREAHRISFRSDAFPDYRFDKAELIVSFSADFLGSWVAPAIFAKRYAGTRKLSDENPTMSRHIQFESRFSLTGANADERMVLKPSDEVRLLLALYDAVARKTGNQTLGAPEVTYDVEQLAHDLLELKGRSLVVSGHNNIDIQLLVNVINSMAGNYGSTLDMDAPLHAGHGDDRSFETFVSELRQGRFSAVMFHQTNPLYHYHQPEAIAEGLEKTPLSVSFASTREETAEQCLYVLPDHHYLESWNDACFKKGYFNLVQPAINPLFNTSQMQDTLLRWMNIRQNFHQYLKQYWTNHLFGTQTEYRDAEAFWKHSLQTGVFEQAGTEPARMTFYTKGLMEAFARLKTAAISASGTEFVVYPHLALFDGTGANNPWLQELPDPVSSVAWDNFAAVSQAFAEENRLREGDIIRINDKLELPVLIQPGMADDCLAIPLGYGRTKAGKAAEHLGGNAFLLSRWDGENRLFAGLLPAWEKTGSGHQFARTQTHFSMEGRAIVRESTLQKYRLDPSAGNELRAYHDKHKVTLYPEDTYEGHHWALLIDLNACSGCSTCVIACQSENNVPVVGKDEVRRRRIMHWIRIDRYYNGDAVNPDIVFQPVMCMHCDHAPCENVCPVAATTHSKEGINQMAYNRCVGTKYCINNCPYKVRRFNWFAYAQNKAFDYHMNSELGRMVLNPDVTVRERGVVEKCSFCIQRIHEAKTTAKIERRRLKDGEIKPACVQACPSDALVFGDLNDKTSRVSAMIKDPRNYQLLEELHTLASVSYLTRIRNR